MSPPMPRMTAFCWGLQALHRNTRGIGKSHRLLQILVLAQDRSHRCIRALAAEQAVGVGRTQSGGTNHILATDSVHSGASWLKFAIYWRVSAISIGIVIAIHLAAEKKQEWNSDDTDKTPSSPKNVPLRLWCSGRWTHAMRCPRLHGFTVC